MKYSLLLFALLVFWGCSKRREIVHSEPIGTLHCGVALVESKNNSRATTISEIHLEIFTQSGTLLLDSTVDCESDIKFISIARITQGEEYLLRIWSETAEGDTIHSPVDTTFSIIANTTTSVSVVLKPRAGSIQFKLVDVPTVVDSLHLTFISDSGTFRASEKRSSRIFLTLDNVPYNASGTLHFSMNNASRIISEWDSTFTFKNEYYSGMFSLVNNGDLAVDLVVEKPGGTVFSGSGDTTTSLDTEAGSLIFTEFCATGGSGSSSAEFVEIYNPSGVAFHSSRLEVLVNGKSIEILNITIPGNSCYTIAGPSGDEWECDTVTSIDISSTSGALYLYSDGVLLDYLLFFNDTDAGWEYLSSSSKTSWELDLSALSATLNNFGEKWNKSENSSIVNGATWYGSPGKVDDSH